VIRILTFDGGGICGLLDLYILKRLQEVCPSVLDVDLLAGTSTGGLIAMGLAQGDKLDDLIALYENEGPTIFHRNILGVGGLTHCRYDNDGYRRLLGRHFGDRKLGDLKKKVLVPTFCVNSAVKRVHCWKPKIFVNFPEDEYDRYELCINVALYTSAAPTYFPIADYYIDGGVVSNNPSMCALAGVLADNKSISDIKLMSFGTGLCPKFIQSKNGSWGLMQWGSRLVDIMIGGSELIQDYQCRAILGDRYLRVNPILKEEISLDNWRACARLKEVAMNFDIGPTVEWLKKEWNCDQAQSSAPISIP
jgi:patatin-like phospholipase/acyl hydrolase